MKNRNPYDYLFCQNRVNIYDRELVSIINAKVYPSFNITLWTLKFQECFIFSFNRIREYIFKFSCPVHFITIKVFF